MTLYVGEAVRIRSSAVGYDDGVLTPTEITTASIEIKNSEGTVVQATTAMTYDTSIEAWYYDWNTASVAAGSYKAKVVLAGGFYNNWEYVTIRLKANPA